jgi:ribose transport system ATP-binding protein
LTGRRILLKELELDVSPNTIVNTLTVAKQQMIEIAKGISYDSKVLIMDEPTAALSINEIRDLFRVIQKLKAKGISEKQIEEQLACFVKGFPSLGGTV